MLTTLLFLAMSACIMASFLSLAFTQYHWPVPDYRHMLARKFEALLAEAQCHGIRVQLARDGIALDGGNYFVFVGG